jgi:hypothetical protein
MVAQQQNTVRDIWGNSIAVNQTLERIRELTAILEQMDADIENGGREMSMYIYYVDELVYLQTQVNTQ